MTEETIANGPLPNGVLDLGDIESLDVVEFEPLHPKTKLPLGWTWQIAGPGHPETVASIRDLGRRNIALRQRREEAQVNGRKYKAADETVEGNKHDLAAHFARRVLGFNTVRIGGIEYAYSPTTVVRMFENDKLGWLYEQFTDFINEQAVFIKGPGTP